MNTAQRCSVLVIALILLHLAAFSQEKKYVKKNLVWQPKAPKAVSSPQPSPSTLPLHPRPISGFSKAGKDFSAARNTNLKNGLECLLSSG